MHARQVLYHKSPASAQETLGKGGGDLISPNWATNIILGSVLLASSCSSWHCESAALVWIDSLWWQTTEWPDLSSSSSSRHSHSGNPRSCYRLHLPCLLECVDILIPKSTGHSSVQTQLLRKWIRRKWWFFHQGIWGFPFSLVAGDNYYLLFCTVWYCHDLPPQSPTFSTGCCTENNYVSFVGNN